MLVITKFPNYKIHDKVLPVPPPQGGGLAAHPEGGGGGQAGHRRHEDLQATFTAGPGSLN